VNETSVTIDNQQAYLEALLEVVRAAGITAEPMAQDAKASGRVAKASRRLSRRQTLDEVGAERFVLPVGGIGGHQEDAGEVSYRVSWTGRHTVTMSHDQTSVKRLRSSYT